MADNDTKKPAAKTGKTGAAKPKPTAAQRRKAAVSALLDAHTDHLMAQLAPGALEKLVQEETAAAFAWMSQVRLAELIQPEFVFGTIRRIVVEMPISGGIPELAGEMSRLVLVSPANRDTRLEDIFPRSHYTGMIEKALSLETLRRGIIHRSVHNTAFPRLIADAMFSIIKDFLLTNNALLRRIPGLAGIVGLWRAAVNVAAPGLDEALELRLRAYVEGHISHVLEQSEEFLVGFLDAEHLMDIAEERYDEASARPLSDHFSNLDTWDLEDFVVLGYEFWLNFRKTRYFEDIYREIVLRFFEKYGDTELDVLVEDMGVGQDLVALEITETLTMLLSNESLRKQVRSRLRGQLEGFYNSKAAAKALTGL